MWLFVGRPGQRIYPEAVVSERDPFFWNNDLCPEEKRTPSWIVLSYICSYVCMYSRLLAEGRDISSILRGRRFKIMMFSIKLHIILRQPTNGLLFASFNCMQLSVSSLPSQSAKHTPKTTATQRSSQEQWIELRRG